MHLFQSAFFSVRWHLCLPAHKRKPRQKCWTSIRYKHNSRRILWQYCLNLLDKQENAEYSSLHKKEVLPIGTKLQHRLGKRNLNKKRNR
jgi:hypothetical protein